MTNCKGVLSGKDAIIAERCSLDIEDWNLHKCSVTTHFNVCLLVLIYFFISDSRCTRDRGRLASAQGDMPQI